MRHRPHSHYGALTTGHGLTGLGFTGLGQGEVPVLPPDYQLPTEEDFVGGLTGALRDISPEWAREHLSVPVAASVPLLQTAAASAAQVDFGALVDLVEGRRLSAEQIKDVAGAIENLVAGALEIAAQLASGTGATAIANAAEAVPMLGAIVSQIVIAIVQAVQAEAYMEAQRERVEQILHQQLHTICGNLLQKFAPTGTGTGDTVVPADFFRQVAITYQMWRKGKYLNVRYDRNNETTWTTGSGPAKLPMDVASMYVLLCGGETQGFGMTRARYEQIVAASRAANPKVKNGVPVKVQRQMWRLIQGIMASVANPLTKVVVSDQGRTLMPILQDLIWQYNVDVSDRGTGGWDQGMAQRLSDVITERYRHTYYERPAESASAIQRSSSCAGQEHGVGRHVDLSTPFVKSVIRYQAHLREQFQNPDGSWRVAPLTKVARNPSGVLQFSGQAGRDAANGILDAVGLRVEGSPLLKMILSAAAGAGGYIATRRYQVGR